MKHLSRVTQTEDGTLYSIGIEFSREELQRAFDYSSSVTLGTLSEFRKNQMLDCELAFLRILVSHVELGQRGLPETLQQLANRKKSIRKK